ncbi:16S rRNA (cytosine(1402)-N(4))-methyltransferase RsmH [Phytoactinopolyspora limicola]|uniref:16S rRNA (cytosine(1402)-N(4))-methyltransferase RsmH n=1 Tax=Phytoactinopolyspora limicola TaxID=2715536 RepID=UPI001FEB83C6|nr:16S rRNA (cytosine(1402)-N(4))-methyltransferase RsmH [Phytoactinopolyspora limicola]
MTPGEPTAGRHVPVLLSRVVEILAPVARDPGAVIVDATLGLGGHAEALLRACPRARLVGLDRDPQALRLAGARLAEYGDRFVPVHAVYDEIGEVLTERGIRRIKAVLFDLGVSSLQLDEADRGFAYAHDAPLDMRMDQHSGGPTAADVLNTYSAGDLTRILRDYGEERYASRIAAAVVRARQREPFTTSERLVHLLRDAIPAPARRTGGHPAKRTFQALRIEVNGELDALRRAMPAAMDALDTGGRVAVLTYHSLEDRITKRAFAAATTSTAPPGLPVELPEHQPLFRLVSRGETPTDAESAANPRAASARLRVVERVAARGEGGGRAGRRSAGSQHHHGGHGEESP